ncbi:hypothetical protein ACEPAH_3985 [Sanghuangporus vaninii]
MSSYIVFCLGMSLFGGLIRLILSRTSNTGQQGVLPPIVPIPEEQIYSNPREAYEKAFKDSGSHVIGVKKKGRLEFIVDDTLLHDVLTDDQSFSFQDGVMTLLNMGYLSGSFTDYFERHDDLVRNAIIKRMPFVINQVFPILLKNAEILTHEVKANEKKHVDALEYFHYSLCEAMTKVILGADFLSKRNVGIVQRLVEGSCRVSGVYQNTSWWGRNFPRTWRTFNWLRELSTSIPTFYALIGPKIWRRLESHNHELTAEESFANSEGSVLDYLAYKYTSRNRHIDLKNFLKITGLIAGNFFAAIHLTSTVSVWVLFELAKRPELVCILREEFSAVVDISASDGRNPTISCEAVHNTKIIDSFIREVLRTKGDILSVCRMVRNDVKLGGYDLPKGHLIFGLTPLLHLNPKYQTPDASEIKYDRWILTNKSAATTGRTHLSFGPGRWACPGRTLAIAEIKMLVWSIIYRATPLLEGDSYEIVDKLEITARAPRGNLILEPCST